MMTSYRCALLAFSAVCLSFLSGSRPAAAASITAEDPLESVNRSVFAFNKIAVTYVIAPLSETLTEMVPEEVKQAGSNIYSNLIEPEFIVTNLLTGNYSGASASAARFGVNSTIGLAGVFDPASSLNIVRTETEFSEALCKAGLPAGNYLVLPLIGPVNTVSAGLLRGFFAVEWYALSLISSVLATADLVVDLSASAASLRDMGEIPDGKMGDAYTIQRREYMAYLKPACEVVAEPERTAAGETP
jgi:phospholipid-binding lipoprotein MlaA